MGFSPTVVLEYIFVSCYRELNLHCQKTYLLLYIWSKMFFSSRDALLKLSKTAPRIHVHSRNWFLTVLNLILWRDCLFWVILHSFCNDSSQMTSNSKLLQYTIDLYKMYSWWYLHENHLLWIISDTCKIKRLGEKWYKRNSY